jgi:glycosyltransferase involved in cell wall biosynthesis
MKIFAISVIKNEADIIKYNLEEASKWAEKIFVYDNGSTDGTWEIVQSLASEKIVAWKSDAKPFYEGMRGEVYNTFKHLASDGDWWCFRLDADEFYIDNPIEFLPSIPSYYHYVATDTYEFVITYEDLEDNIFIGQAEKDIQHLKFYTKTTWSEARFFRHRARLQWETERDMPKYIGILSPSRIKVRHFQYRSPQQIQLRVATRLQARKDGFVGWDHAAQTDWKSYLKHRADLFKDEGAGELPTLGPRNKYFQRTYDYLLKRILHGLHILP